MLLVAVGTATSSKGREAGVSEGDRLPGCLKPETWSSRWMGPEPSSLRSHPVRAGPGESPWQAR